MTVEKTKQDLRGYLVAAMGKEFPELGKDLDFVLWLGDVAAGRPYTVEEKDKWIRAMAIASHMKKYPGIHFAEPHAVMDIEEEYIDGYECGWFWMASAFK